MNAVPISSARAASDRWWQQFWDRSWIDVSGTEDAARVSQGYIMQRYMMAASSRGPFPTKFNGGLFTVGHDMPADRDSTDANHNPDYRAWGNSYWNQNTRLLYYPLVATGDFDLLAPWFDMYMRGLPLAEDRTRLYFHHSGAAFVETGYFWGLPNLNDFGWNNPTDVVQSNWMRYHIQGTLEVIAQMLDEYDVTQDTTFARKDIVPFATAILAYYDQHWQRGPDGKILLSPAQSIETYQLDAVNPTPDIAGMMDVLPRLLALPAALTSVQQRQAWTKLLADLPPIATGKTKNGKLPRQFGISDADGNEIILPAEKYGPTRNSEMPALRGLPVSPLWSRKTGSQACPRYVCRPALPAKSLMGPGRSASRCTGTHGLSAKNCNCRIYRLRQSAFPLVLEGGARLDSGPRQRWNRHDHARTHAHADRRQAHPVAARMACGLDGGLQAPRALQDHGRRPRGKRKDHRPQSDSSTKSEGCCSPLSSEPTIGPQEPGIANELTPRDHAAYRLRQLESTHPPRQEDLTGTGVSP